MIGEVARAEQPLLLAGVPDEEDRALRLHLALRERLGELEHRHGAGAVVVGAVVDRVAPRRPQRAHASRGSRGSPPRAPAPRAARPALSGAPLGFSVANQRCWLYRCSESWSTGPVDAIARRDRCARRSRRTRPRSAGSAPGRIATTLRVGAGRSMKRRLPCIVPPVAPTAMPLDRRAEQLLRGARASRISVTSADGAFGAGGSVSVGERARSPARRRSAPAPPTSAIAAARASGLVARDAERRALAVVQDDQLARRLLRRERVRRVARPRRPRSPARRRARAACAPRNGSTT